MRGAILYYCLNKFMPFVVLGALLIISFEPNNWIPCAIFALTIFIERFSFKVGYSVGFCEKHDLMPNTKEDV